MIIKNNDIMGVKLLFVYKNNPQDPTQKSLLKTFPFFLKSFHTFCFNRNERIRFDLNNLKISNRFIETINTFKPTHIFMWLVYLNPEELQICKEKGIKLIAAINGFASFSTGLYKSRNLYIQTLKLLDVFFIPHEPHIPKLKSFSINAIELPFSYDPTTFKKLPIIRAINTSFNKFFFVGNFGDSSVQSAYRIEMLKKISESGKLLIVSDIKINHTNISHMQPISYESILNLLANTSKYLICSDYFPNLNEYNKLNESEVIDYDQSYQYAIRPRIYTMIGSGSPVIIERHIQLQRFFEDGKHLIMWSNYEELNDKISFYDQNKSLYKKLSEDAIEHVSKYHTTANRIREIIIPALLKC